VKEQYTVLIYGIQKKKARGELKKLAHGFSQKERDKSG
jgi:hypothetical protein